jgi:alpha-L-rhamnosidase
VLYQRFGDLEVLRAQYSSAKAWVDQISAIGGETHLWEGTFQFGDWVDPDAPPEQPAKAKVSGDIVASAHLFRSTDLLARAAALLGYTQDAAYYRDQAELARAAWLATYVSPMWRIVSDAQTAYAMALEYGIVTDPAARQAMGDRLAFLVRRDGYRIGTGFVGTPLVPDALTSTGHVAQAARMLLQTGCPSWLYSVTMGATTVWERWDSLLPDGSINPGEMTSFNHYALGAIADWLHRRVGGIAPGEPGYRSLDIAPVPLPGLDWAKAALRTPYGLATVEWRRSGSSIEVDVVVPANADAIVRLPDGEVHAVGAGSHRWTVAAPAEPSHRALSSSSAMTEIIDDVEAYTAVLAAIDAVDPRVAEGLRRDPWLTGRPLLGSFMATSTAARDAAEQVLTQLNASRGL